jgi:hypothetical protein
MAENQIIIYLHTVVTKNSEAPNEIIELTKCGCQKVAFPNHAVASNQNCLVWIFVAACFPAFQTFKQH